MTDRSVSVKFKGLPSLATMRSELDLAARYVPGHTQMAELADNESTDPELRELTFIFTWDGYQA